MDLPIVRRGLEFLTQSLGRYSPTSASGYSVQDGQQGRKFVVVDGYHIGSIFDRESFQESFSRFPDWLSGAEYEIAQRFEDSTREAAKSLGPRRNSGLHAFSHIDRNVVEALRNSKLANVPLDFMILLGHTGHDRPEDDAEVQILNEGWRSATIEGNHEKREALTVQLQETISRKRDEIRTELMGYIPPSVRASKREDLEQSITGAAHLIFGVTRFPDRSPYPFSVGDQYRRFDVAPSAKEHPDVTFRRISIKNADRNVNMRETGQLVRPVTQRGIYKAFNDTDETGQYLREMYGTVRDHAVPMSGAERIRMVFESILPLHHASETFNELPPYILGTLRASRTAALQWLAIVSTREMGRATLELSDQVIGFYEKFPEIARIKHTVDDEIRSKQRGNFYGGLTIYGPARDWMVWDPLPRKVIQSLDDHPELRQQNYRHTRDFREAILGFLRTYGVNAPNSDGRVTPLDDVDQLDPEKHKFFTLEGVEALRSLMPNYWQHVADLNSPNRGLSSSRYKGIARSLLM